MKTYKNQIFHIFNQGNNRDRIFFNEGNYLYFLEKLRKYLLPYGHMINYCLMPNHFHLLFYLNENEVLINDSLKKFNQAIGTMLMSYSKAINIQQKRTGSLFRSKTKVTDPWVDGFITFNNNSKYQDYSDNNFIQNVFHYIHQNPVRAGLVKKAEEWKYSSASDYLGLRNGTLCDKEWVFKNFGIIVQ